MLQNKEHLQNAKNLLAFSAGGDSTALLFLLLQNNISFDIAIVDYGLREQSKEECRYAQELAQKYNFQCFIHHAKPISKNFEAEARAVRYTFFESLIQEHNYDNLLTAHHLGDRFEWMLMQFCKGAGCVELAGMQAVQERSFYKLLRPLLACDKSELLAYLHKRDILYFEDASNEDEKYSRNLFRKEHARPLLQKYLKGIKESFRYLDEDRSALTQVVEIKRHKEFIYFASVNKRSDIFAIDNYFKSIGKVLSAQERALLKEERTVVIARKYVVNQEHGFVFIAPYLQDSTISKKQKEQFRLMKIEPKLRAYLSTDTELVSLLSLLLQ